MKILIAEDDLVTREILKRMLTHMSTSILLAGNGVEALEIIEREDPDFMVTDLQMPVLDGLAVVEAVRASTRHARMPIVCLSAVKNKDEITHLVGLGIADYILKPIRTSEVQDRFQRVIAQHAGWRQAPGDSDRDSILVVDPDDAFRKALGPLLDATHVLLEATSGAQALRLFQEAKPKPVAVLVTEGLHLMREEQLVGVLAKAAIDARCGIPTFWLVTTRDRVPESKARHFAGLIPRSLDPDALDAALRRTILAPGEDRQDASVPRSL